MNESQFHGQDASEKKLLVNDKDLASSSQAPDLPSSSEGEPIIKGDHSHQDALAQEQIGLMTRSSLPRLCGDLQRFESILVCLLKTMLSSDKIQLKVILSVSPAPLNRLLV